MDCGNAAEPDVRVRKFYTYEMIVNILQKQSNPYSGLERPFGLQEVQRETAYEGRRVVSPTQLPLYPA